MGSLTQRMAGGFHVPDDPTLLAELGRVSVLHSHLDYILKMTIRTLSGVSVHEVRDATTYESSSSLRERIKKLARQAIGEGPALIKLQALMQRCKRATERRNALVHGIYAKDMDGGEPIMSDADWSWKSQPSLDELKELSSELETLTNEINNARFHGFLAEALLGKGSKRADFDR